MNLINRLRQTRDFMAKRSSVGVAPLEWMVETTNRCNLACPMCTRNKVYFRQSDMEFEHFQVLLERHPDVEAIWPYGFGEPLMNPRIFDFIRFAKKQNRSVVLSTNATFLDQEASVKLLRSGLDYLILPIDGVDQATYETNRYPAALDKLEANLDNFLRLKQTLRVRMHVTVQMIRMDNNRNQAGAFRRKWRRPGVDVVRVRDDLSPKRSIPSSEGRTRRPHRPCFFLWRGPLFVQAAGTVIPCPYYHGSPPFGSLHERSALEIWNSEEMNTLRRAHSSGDLSKYPLCEQCPRYQPHRILAAVSFFATTSHIRRILPTIEHFQRVLQFKLFE